LPGEAEPHGRQAQFLARRDQEQFLGFPQLLEEFSGQFASEMCGSRGCNLAGTSDQIAAGDHGLLGFRDEPDGDHVGFEGLFVR
jgi:hypothetical protein